MRAPKAGAAEPALVQDPDQIDDHILAAQTLRELCLVVNVAVLQHEARQHQQVLVQLPVPGQRRDPMIVLEQTSGEPRPEKAGAAENADG